MDINVTHRTASGMRAAYVTFADPVECWAAWYLARKHFHREVRAGDQGVAAGRTHYNLTVKYVDAYGHAKPYVSRHGHRGFGDACDPEDVFHTWESAYHRWHSQGRPGDV